MAQAGKKVHTLPKMDSIDARIKQVYLSRALIALCWMQNGVAAALAVETASLAMLLQVLQ